MSKNQNIVITLERISLLDITTIESYFIQQEIWINGDVILKDEYIGNQRYTLQITCKNKDIYFKALRCLSACTSD